MLKIKFKQRYDSRALRSRMYTLIYQTKKNATGKAPKFSENSQVTRKFRLH